MRLLIKTIRKHESELKNINASLKSIKRSIETLPKANIDTQIKRDKSKHGKKRKFWPKKIISILVFILFIFVIYIFNHPKTDKIQKGSNPISGFIKYPPWIFVYEEESIEITLINSSQTPLKIEETKSLLLYPQEAFIEIMSNNGSSITQFDALDTAESKTKMIKFQLNNSVGFKTMNLTLKITTRTIPDIIEKPLPIIVIPIPYIIVLILFHLGLAIMTSKSWGADLVNKILKLFLPK
jgi:hypothetical protein